MRRSISFLAHIAHTGAMGVGMPVPTAQQVSVVFSENATTTYIRRAPLALSGHDADIGVGGMSLWWAVCRSLVIGTRPTFAVPAPIADREMTMITDKQRYRSRWIRPITPRGAQRCTCRRTQSPSTSSTFIRRETNGDVRYSFRPLIGAPFLFISLTMLTLTWVSLVTDRVGI
jgi:hypothetical protein